MLGNRHKAAMCFFAVFATILFVFNSAIADPPEGIDERGDWETLEPLYEFLATLTEGGDDPPSTEVDLATNYRNGTDATRLYALWAREAERERSRLTEVLGAVGYEYLLSLFEASRVPSERDPWAHLKDVIERNTPSSETTREQYLAYRLFVALAKLEMEQSEPGRNLFLEISHLLLAAGSERGSLPQLVSHARQTIRSAECEGDLLRVVGQIIAVAPYYLELTDERMSQLLSLAVRTASDRFSKGYVDILNTLLGTTIPAIAERTRMNSSHGIMTLLNFTLAALQNIVDSTDSEQQRFAVIDAFEAYFQNNPLGARPALGSGFKGRFDAAVRLALYRMVTKRRDLLTYVRQQTAVNNELALSSAQLDCGSEVQLATQGFTFLESRLLGGTPAQQAVSEAPSNTGGAE